MTNRTCTAQLAVTGLCGKPAVFTFTSRNGEVFSECAEHHLGPVTWVNHTPAPAVTTKSVTFTHPATGNKVRTQSGHRYIVVVDYTGRKAAVLRRTNNLATAIEVARRNRSGRGAAVVFDRFTGNVVA
jgi:hypothetical protein